MYVCQYVLVYHICIYVIRMIHQLLEKRTTQIVAEQWAALRIPGYEGIVPDLYMSSWVCKYVCQQVMYVCMYIHMYIVRVCPHTYVCIIYVSTNNWLCTFACIYPHRVAASRAVRESNKIDLERVSHIHTTDVHYSALARRCTFLPCSYHDSRANDNRRRTNKVYRSSASYAVDSPVACSARAELWL